MSTETLTPDATERLPLPVLSNDPKTRMPPPELVQVMGPILATYLHNYNCAGPIYRYYDIYARKEMVGMAGVEANLFITRNGRALFGAKDFRQKQLDELGSDKYIVGMDGDDHYRHRKLITRGYSRTTIEHRYPDIAEITRNQARRWQTGASLSAYRALQEIVTEQIGAMMLNYATPEKWQTICGYVSAMIASSFSSRPLDEKRQAVYDHAKAEVMALMDEVIAAHRATPQGDHPHDLVDDLLAAVEEGRESLTEQEMRVDALTVYIAGIEPVAHSCTFMLYGLLKHPDILKEVVDEVQSVLADAPLSPDTLREMKNLRYATMEMLRMYPFAPVLQMIALESFDFQGYYIEAGTPIIASQAVSHYLPELYANPYEFDIDRYRPHRAEHRQSGAFAPYGVGHHICLGAGFSEVQIMITMATLLSTVDLALEPDGVTPMPGMRDPAAFKVRVIGQRA